MGFFAIRRGRSFFFCSPKKFFEVGGGVKVPKWRNPRSNVVFLWRSTCVVIVFICSQTAQILSSPIFSSFSLLTVDATQTRGQQAGGSSSPPFPYTTARASFLFARRKTQHTLFLLRLFASSSAKTKHTQSECDCDVWRERYRLGSMLPWYDRG